MFRLALFTLFSYISQMANSLFTILNRIVRELISYTEYVYKCERGIITVIIKAIIKMVKNIIFNI